MEPAAFAGWVAVGVVGVLCLGARVRQMLLHAHTASLRDRDEYRYTQVRQTV